MVDLEGCLFDANDQLEEQAVDSYLLVRSVVLWWLVRADCLGRSIGFLAVIYLDFDTSLIRKEKG
jgi:hypothetical protein